MSEIDRFVNKYAEAIRDEHAAIFAGAGLSIPAGFVNWADLMRDIAVDVGLDVDREHDLISVAQYHVNEHSGRHRINQALINEFAERSTLSENHKILASLPLRTYWTTNYDNLLESALREAKKRPDVKSTEASLARTLPRRDAVIYKMHGDIGSPEEAVVTRDDYESYHRKRPLFSTAFSGDLVAKTFLFIGFSFTDPNLNYLLSRIRIFLAENRRDHYCLLRRVQQTDFTSAHNFDYARGRQDLQIRDLKRYGIHVLLLDSYAEITEVLQRISKRYQRSRVFVSGSAVEYGNWTKDQAQDLVRKIGAALIGAGLDVVSGFGLGIGPYLLNGVLDGIAREGTTAFHDRVTIRPFPQGMTDPIQRANRWREYRQDMLGTAGIALFLFGNQHNETGTLQDAPGVFEEFEIALARGLAIVPVGATGYMARKIHQRVMGEYEAHYSGLPGMKAKLQGLAEEVDDEELIVRVLDVISQIRSEG